MAGVPEGGGKDEVKTQFVTREGTYKLMNLSEYSRPNRTMVNGQVNTPVHVSFINLGDQQGTGGERICFNVGRELYFYVYKGVRKAVDLTKPIDKRIYKGTNPTCHDFNTFTANADILQLLVGFSQGQVQLIDPVRRESVPGKLFNEERQIDKTKVTCIKWIPGSPNQFVVSHSSGHMYVFSEDLPCSVTIPTYQTFKQGDNFSVHTCKTKSTRNPMYRWVIGDGAINEFAFSPCAKYLAVVGQDGYLRVFSYDSMELVGTMRSYFGGLLCVAWSPDGRYIATGGEDDLVTVWSFHDHRVICRGKGHKSWVNIVTFDEYTTSLDDLDSFEFAGSDEDILMNINKSKFRESLKSANSMRSSHRNSTDTINSMTSYRFGSVGQDTQLCLWDLTEEVLRRPFGRHRGSTIISQNAVGVGNTHNNSHSESTQQLSNSLPNSTVLDDSPIIPNHSQSHSVTNKFATLTLGDHKHKEKHKRNFSLGVKSDKMSAFKGNHVRPLETVKMLGTVQCPGMNDVPMLEPLVCKKISHERLTSLVFREECIVTACQDGYVCTWARPGKASLSQQTQPTAQGAATANANGTVV